ncbi:hypothetical protein ACF0H5_007840 [Mactra antiquata]
MFRVIFFAFLVYTVYGETNLFINGDFETTTYDGSDWYCQGNCKLTASTDSRSGQNSVLVTERNKLWKGAAQRLDLIGGERYKITAYVKLLQLNNNKQYQEIKLTMKCKNSAGKTVYFGFGTTPLVFPGEWFQVGGVHKTDEGSTDCRIYIATDVNTDYLLDDAEAIHIPVNDAWRDEAKQRIEELRKDNIRIRLSGDNVNTSMVHIQLQQTKMKFPLGSVMNADKIVDTEDASNLRYQQVFYENFEWGVLGNALKWKQMQPRVDKVIADKPLNAMLAMKEHGIKQRCHCAFWGVDDRVQDWVKQLDAESLKAAVFERINNVTALTDGMCEHWDVNNEMLHGDFYERSTKDITITPQMFSKMNQLDPDAALYLNDYNVLNNGITTVALKEAGQKFKDFGAPIGGIGVQGHMHGIDIPLMKARLDILEEAGLNVMITEFAINEEDDGIKAQNVEDTLTLFFSHPAVEGVLFWGFWDGRIWEPLAPLFNGPDVTPNAAGKVYQNIFHNEWRTRAYQTLLGEEPFEVRGFMGDYSLTVSYQGVTLATQTFSLTGSGQDVDIQLNGEPGSPSVSNIVTN